MPTASPADVRVEIETRLDDTEITAVLERVERDLERELDTPPTDGSDDRKDLEAVLAAHHIATSLDRAESKASSGRTSVTYEQSVVDELKARAKRLGATDALLGIGGSKPSAGISVPDARGTD